MTNGPTPDLVPIEQCNLNDTPEELKNLITDALMKLSTEDLYLKDWGNLSMVSKIWHDHIRYCHGH